MTFGHWTEDLHNEPDQKKRQKSALGKDLTPLKIHHDVQGGIFKGKDEVYYCTNLEACECMDFARRGLPCKHMYRLAMELGAFPGIEQAQKDNPEDMLRKMASKLTPDTVMDMISDLPEDEQVEFAFFLYHCGNGNKKGAQMLSIPLARKLSDLNLVDLQGDIDSLPKNRKNIRATAHETIADDAMRIHKKIRTKFPPEIIVVDPFQ